MAEQAASLGVEESLSHARRELRIGKDLEGFEQRALRGAARLIRECRPRMAITAYHYGDDLLALWRLFEELAPDCELRLRHDSSYYYDTIFYASPREPARPA